MARPFTRIADWYGAIGGNVSSPPSNRSSPVSASKAFSFPSPSEPTVHTMPSACPSVVDTTGEPFDAGDAHHAGVIVGGSAEPSLTAMRVEPAGQFTPCPLKTTYVPPVPVNAAPAL